jgi:hypothetical protein
VNTSLSALQGSREDSTNFCTVAVRADKLRRGNTLVG